MPNGGQYRGWREKKHGDEESLTARDILYRLGAREKQTGEGIWIREDEN